MPANRPEDLSGLFMAAFNSGNLDALLALYESDSVLEPQPGKFAFGQEGIRGALSEFLDLKGTITLDTTRCVQAGGLALMHSAWSLTAPGTDGNTIAGSGRSTEVARRQPDSTWKFVIDLPDDG